MSKIKLLTISVIGLLLINIGIVSFLLFNKHPSTSNGKPPIGRHDGPPPMMDEGPKKIIIDRLQFDTDQIVAYEKLIEIHQQVVKSLDDSIIVSKKNLYQSLQHETFAGKDSLMNILGYLQKKIEIVHFEHFEAIKKLCKPNQLERFNQLTNDLAGFFSISENEPPPPDRQ